MASSSQIKAFQEKVWPYCQQVAAATGLSPCLFLCQWAVETEYGTCASDETCSLTYNNWAGITWDYDGCPSKCNSTYCCYSGLSQWATQYVVYLKQGAANGIPGYQALLDTAGESLETQMTALGNSAWAGSHYGSPPGSDLWSIWEDIFSSYGLSCGATSTTPPPPPPVKTTGSPTPLKNVILKAERNPVPLLVLAGGVAALAGWGWYVHPDLGHDIEQEFAVQLVNPSYTAGKQGVEWIRAHL